MLKTKLVILYYAAKIAFCSCAPEETKGLENIRSQASIQKLASLPLEVNESSGLSMIDHDTFWTHNDSGGANKLYAVKTDGSLIDSLSLEEHQNIDWEDLTKDEFGHLYIGDFGNNLNLRRNLKVIKAGNGLTEEISFTFADQKSFPPAKREFDCEAFFHFNGKLHLFTKSWEMKQLRTKHYELPDKAGHYDLEPKNIFEVNAAVTAADISPDKKKFALLTYGKILLFGIENDAIDFSNPMACLKTKRKQTEAITFNGNDKILMTNEQGELFEINL